MVGLLNTGSRTSCRSRWGVFDMVGNAREWVADWADRANVGCTHWTSETGTIVGDDLSCFGGNGADSFNNLAGALQRGGQAGDGADAGVFNVIVPDPSFTHGGIGFRCAR